MDPSYNNYMDVGPTNGKPTITAVGGWVGNDCGEEIPGSSFLLLTSPSSSEDINKPSTSIGKEGDDYNEEGFYYHHALGGWYNIKPTEEESYPTMEKFVVRTNGWIPELELEIEPNSSTEISWKFPILMIASSVQICEQVKGTRCRNFDTNQRVKNTLSIPCSCIRCCILNSRKYYSTDFARLHKNSFKYEVDVIQAQSRLPPEGMFQPKFQFLMNACIEDFFTLFNGTTCSRSHCDKCGITNQIEKEINTWSSPLTMDSSQSVSELLFDLPLCSCGPHSPTPFTIREVALNRAPKVIQVHIKQDRNHPRGIRDGDLDLEFLCESADNRSNTKSNYNLTAAYCVKGTQNVIVCRGRDGIYYEYDTSLGTTICTRGRLWKLLPLVFIYTLSVQPSKPTVVMDPDGKKRCVYTGILLKEPDITGMNSQSVFKELKKADVPSIEYYVGLYTGGHRVRPAHFYRSSRHASSIYRTVTGFPKRRVFQGPIIPKQGKTDMRHHEAFLIAFGRAARLRALRKRIPLSQRMINIAAERTKPEDKRIASMLAHQGEQLFCFDHSQHAPNYHEIPGYKYHVGIHVNYLTELTQTALKGTVKKVPRTKVFECYCRIRCVTKQGLYQHIRAHHRGVCYRCKQCEKKYLHRLSLKEHIKTKHEKKTVRCPHCGKEYKWMRTLNRHISSQHKGISYQCDTCGKKYMDKINLMNHISSKHNKEMIHCPLCEEKFQWQTSFNRHFLYKHKGVSHDCSTCGLKFRDKDTLLHHIRSKHERNTSIPSLRDKKRTTYDCKECGKKLSDNQSLKEHFRAQHEKRKLGCPHCDKSFQYARGLRLHISYEHKGSTYDCKECGKKFREKCTLMAHIRNQHEKKSCTKCDKQFPSQMELRKHVRFQHKGISYDCKICGSKDMNWRVLMEHTRSQHEKTTVDCPQCDRPYKSQSGLMRHIRYEHEGISNNCKTCGKTFITKYHMMEHMKGQHGKDKLRCPKCKKQLESERGLRRHILCYHDGVTHDCKICGKKYMDKGTLSEHIRGQHGKEKLRCPQCKKLYETERTLKTHICSHGKRMSHECIICGKKYIRKGTLTNHIKKKH